jgi:hypothetical protein
MRDIRQVERELDRQIRVAALGKLGLERRIQRNINARELPGRQRRELHVAGWIAGELQCARIEERLEISLVLLPCQSTG